MEVNDLIELTRNLIRTQNRADSEAEKNKKELDKQKKLESELNKEIIGKIEMNAASDTQEENPKKRKASDLLMDDDFLDYESDDSVDGDEEEVDEDELSEDEDSCQEEIRLSAYVPCAAHNIQLVLKDALKLSEEYTELISKVSKNIVSKAQFSSVIAEELRNFGNFKKYLPQTLKNL